MDHIGHLFEKVSGETHENDTKSQLVETLKGIQVKSHIEDLVERADREENVPTRIVPMQQSRRVAGHFLMRVAAARETRIHVHIVARKVQRDQDLEHNTPSGVNDRQEAREARCCATIGDHVQDSAQSAHLVVLTGHGTVKSIQKTRNPIHKTREHRVVAHGKQRHKRGDHPHVTYLVWDVP